MIYLAFFNLAISLGDKKAYFLKQHDMIELKFIYNFLNDINEIISFYFISFVIFMSFYMYIDIK